MVFVYRLKFFQEQEILQEQRGVEKIAIVDNLYSVNKRENAGKLDIIKN